VSLFTENTGVSKKMRSLRNAGRKRGQVLVLVAIGILALIGAFGLSTDVAIFYFNWAQLRKEVDAAALAGANYLPDNPSQATSTAATWVSTNGMAGDTILKNSTGSQGYNGTAYSSITVQVQRTVPYYFAKPVRAFFGSPTTAPITVTATAGVEPISGAKGWVPVGMPCKGASCYNGGACTSNSDGTGCYSCGKTVTLQNGQSGPGDWGALICPTYGTGEPGYSQGIINGCPDGVAVGGTVTSKPGNPNKTEKDFNQRICGSSSCPSSSPPSGVCTSGGSTLNPSDPHVVLLPLVDTSQFQGRTTAQVYGFAEGWVVSASGSTVTIEFIMGPVDASGNPNPNGPATGAYGAVLLQ
jgi:Flp pilus assembly protein TadG